MTDAVGRRLETVTAVSTTTPNADRLSEGGTERTRPGKNHADAENSQNHSKFRVYHTLGNNSQTNSYKLIRIVTVLIKLMALN